MENDLGIIGYEFARLFSTYDELSKEIEGKYYYDQNGKVVRLVNGVREVMIYINHEDSPIYPSYIVDVNSESKTIDNNNNNNKDVEFVFTLAPRIRDVEHILRKNLGIHVVVWKNLTSRKYRLDTIFVDDQEIDERFFSVEENENYELVLEIGLYVALSYLDLKQKKYKLG